MNFSDDGALVLFVLAALFFLGIITEAGKYSCDNCERCEKCSRRLLTDLSCPKCDKKYIK